MHWSKEKIKYRINKKGIRLIFIKNVILFIIVIALDIYRYRNEESILNKIILVLEIIIMLIAFIWDLTFPYEFRVILFDFLTPSILIILIICLILRI